MDKELEMMFVDKSKTQADGSKYFALLDKHIPSGLGPGTRVMLYALGNLDCILKIIEKNPAAEYIVSDSAVMSKILPLVTKSRVKFVPFCLDRYNIFGKYDMKFDCIVMNPPYSRNLHLKILAEAIKHLKDEKSVCVNLSPDTWLNDFADVNKKSDFNKFKDKLHISSIERIGLANKLFDLGHCTYTLAIYVCLKNDSHALDLHDELYSDIQIVDNVVMPKWLNKRLKNLLVDFISKDKSNSLDSHIKSGCVDDNTLWTRYIPRLVGNPGERCSQIASIGLDRWDKTFYKGICNGKTYSDTKKKLANVKNYSDFDYIEFSSENEALNWRNSCDTNFMHYICMLVHVDSHRHARWLPWLGDTINPRTKLKGYKGEWTDADLYQFFNITPEEQKTIEETMEKYK